MKMMNDEWVFYLRLSPKLDRKFIALDAQFKNYGLNLIPVDFKNLCNITKNSLKANVIVLVKNQREMELYNKHIRKLMKMMIVCQRVQLFQVSSFSTCNHFDLGRKDNYHFYQLPETRTNLCEQIISQIMDTPETKNVWPGGRSPRVTMERE